MPRVRRTRGLYDYLFVERAYGADVYIMKTLSACTWASATLHDGFADRAIGVLWTKGRHWRGAIDWRRAPGRDKETRLSSCQNTRLATPVHLQKFWNQLPPPPLYIYPSPHDNKVGSGLFFAIWTCSPITAAQMDLQTLSNLFASTFSPDPNVQKLAELQIRKVRPSHTS